MNKEIGTTLNNMDFTEAQIKEPCFIPSPSSVEILQWWSNIAGHRAHTISW